MSAGLHLVTVVVPDYDSATRFYCEGLGFVVDVDTPALTNDGRPKRWVVLRCPAGGAGLLLGQASSPEQAGRIGDQTGGRVAFFLAVDAVADAAARASAAGATLVGSLRHEPYGDVQVIRDPFGNLWDLNGPVAC